MHGFSLFVVFVKNAGIQQSAVKTGIKSFLPLQIFVGNDYAGKIPFPVSARFFFDFVERFSRKFRIVVSFRLLFGNKTRGERNFRISRKRKRQSAAVERTDFVRFARKNEIKIFAYSPEIPDRLAIRIADDRFADHSERRMCKRQNRESRSFAVFLRKFQYSAAFGGRKPHSERKSLQIHVDRLRIDPRFFGAKTRPSLAFGKFPRIREKEYVPVIPHPGAGLMRKPDTLKRMRKRIIKPVSRRAVGLQSEIRHTERTGRNRINVSVGKTTVVERSYSRINVIEFRHKKTSR